MIFGIPTTLWSSMFGAVTGFVFKLISQKQELNASRDMHNAEMLVKVATANTSAVKDEAKLLEAKAEYEGKLSAVDPHRSMARRVLAFGIMFGLLFFLPAYILFGDIQWFLLWEHTVSSNGFFGLGAYSKEVVEVITAHGLPIAWLTAMLDVFAGIISFYFGGSLAKFRNPYVR